MRISELLLQTQKLAEERAEGSIEEPATEGEDCKVFYSVKLLKRCSENQSINRGKF